MTNEASADLLPCPSPECGGECAVYPEFAHLGPSGCFQVVCAIIGCGYHGPFAATQAEAIALHNAMPRATEITRLQTELDRCIKETWKLGTQIEELQHERAGNLWRGAEHAAKEPEDETLYDVVLKDGRYFYGYSRARKRFQHGLSGHFFDDELVLHYRIHEPPPGGASPGIIPTTMAQLRSRK